MSQQRPPTSPNGTAKPQSPPKPDPPTKPFDIDNYFNPYIPRNPLRLLPPYISYWFGFRQHPSQRHPYFSLHSSFRDYRLPKWYYIYHMHTAFLYTSILLGAFCGVAIIENVFLALPQLNGHAVPIVIASFGAAAILEYNTIESPLAQPRNLILGHFLSAAVGVGITKLFLLLPGQRFEDLRWIAGALAVGVASVLMSFTKTIHPPAGATALLAASNLEIQEMGWWLLPLVLLASMLMLGSALVVNNGMGRRYPVYWWTPLDLASLKEERKRERAKKASQDVEKGGEGLSEADTEDGALEVQQDLRKKMSRDRRLSHAVSYSSGDRVPHREVDSAGKETTIGHGVIEGESILISRSKLVVPEWLELSDWEDEVLRILMERMRERQGQAG